jgi:hypothetical protein
MDRKRTFDIIGVMEQDIEVKISAKWGSEFQRSISYQSLILMLKAWTAFRRATHSKNKLSISIDSKDIDDIQPDGV